MLDEAQTGVTKQTTDKQNQTRAGRTTSLCVNLLEWSFMLDHGSPFSTKYRLEFGSNSSMGILKFGKMLDLSDSQPLTWSLANTFMVKGNKNWSCFIYYTTQWLYWRGHRNS
jgi:hypothetical protein